MKYVINKNRKKKVFAVLLFILVLGLSYFGVISIKKQTKNKQIEKTIQKLPNFSFYTLNNEAFTYNNSINKPTLIIYFHPECEHCQYEAKQLLLNKEKFSTTQILMVSPAPLVEIQQFNSDYQLNKIESLKVLWDKEIKFETYFGIALFPTILIYDTKDKLQKKYKGEVKIETILKHLGEE